MTRLEAPEAAEVLDETQYDGYYDLVVAADVFSYVGKLEETFRQVSLNDVIHVRLLLMKRPRRT